MAATERGGAAGAAAASDSDSDYGCPEKEPEFVIDIVDGHPPPPPPPPRQRMIWFGPPEPLPEPDYADMPKECTNCFIVKIVHFILVISGGAAGGAGVLQHPLSPCVTLMLAARLPDEYKEGDGGFIMACPILIGVVALSWLMLSKYDKEQC